MTEAAAGAGSDLAYSADEPTGPAEPAGQTGGSGASGASGSAGGRGDRRAGAKIRKLVIVGGGKMGSAIAARVVQTGLLPAERVVVCEPDETARERLAARAGKVAVAADSAAAVQGASTVLLAVTPQVMPVVMEALRGRLHLDQLVVSIAAGVELQTLEMGLRHAAIIRVMTNTPAQVGQSISAWIATVEVTDAQKAEARAILRAFGQEFEVDRERYLDMVTAVSGSGPAWIMLMLESMIDAGVQIGLRPDWAKELALQTMSGSVELMRQTGKHPAELRNMVTTPAGTTAAGLHAMEKGGLRAAIASGIVAAYERCLELGAAARK